jgi:Uma2 family endonuclease
VAAAPAEPPVVSVFPPRPPFTVDSLFDLPDSDLRYEVLEGQLVVSPAPEPKHNRAADRLQTQFNLLLPPDFEAITNTAIRMPNGDGPIPDLLVTSVDAEEYSRGIPADFVHTVVEVVSPSNSSDDRLKKPALYATAGIPCYWRVELKPWSEHLGPVPAIVVRLLGEDGDWHTTLHPAGKATLLPLAIGRGPDLLPVELDPATLVGRRTLAR